jgi:hypothetical protein
MYLVRSLGIAITALGLVLASCSSDDNGEKKDSGTSNKDVGEVADGSDKDQGSTVDAPVPDASSKVPVITAIIPSDGFADGGTLGHIPVLLSGKNFAAGARVYIDGGTGGILMQVSVASEASVTFKMPKNPYGNATSGYKPYTAGVSILCNGELSNVVNFQYTKSVDMDAKFKGSILTTKSSSYADFYSKPIEGQVYLEGVTTSASDSGKIKAYVGYNTKKTGTDPSKDPDWRWIGAKFSKQDSTGTYHVFAGTLKVPMKQTYDVAYRFSKDLGQTYIYADTDETDLKYDSTKAASLTATAAPQGYCQTDSDCLIYAYKPVCKKNAIDDTKSVCVGCLSNNDCTIANKALGPFCDMTKLQCYCKADADCKNNPNGFKCSSSKYCSCAADSDCPKGKKCDSQTYICM